MNCLGLEPDQLSEKLFVVPFVISFLTERNFLVGRFFTPEYFYEDHFGLTESPANLRPYCPMRLAMKPS
jgi:hypothetical protein